MKNVHKAILNVMTELGKEGIGKNRKNTIQGYAFRGIDDVLASLSPLLSKHGLLILPRVINSRIDERTTKSGGSIIYTTLTVEYDFISAEDGSTHTICVIGEGMDSSDKSSNKAMSAAYKYACIQAFCIPVEGIPDADQDTHEIEPRMDENSFLDFVSAIESSADIESLKKVFGSAHVAAKKARDSNAAAKLKTAYDKKKAEFSEPQDAPV